MGSSEEEEEEELRVESRVESRVEAPNTEMLFSPTSLDECVREWDDLEKNYQQIQVQKQPVKEVLLGSEPAWTTSTEAGTGELKKPD